MGGCSPGVPFLDWDLDWDCSSRSRDGFLDSLPRRVLYSSWCSDEEAVMFVGCARPIRPVHVVSVGYFFLLLSFAQLNAPYVM